MLIFPATLVDSHRFAGSVWWCNGGTSRDTSGQNSTGIRGLPLST